MSEQHSTSDSHPFQYEKGVFVSYAWGGEGEEIVNQIEQVLQTRGVKLIRDKQDLGFRDSIHKFMERLGRGNCVIVVISDKYLRSPNCMFELVEITEAKQFCNRVFPIVLSDANIYDPIKRIEYVRYWESKRAELAAAMGTVDPANLQGIRDDIDLYDRIRDEISGLTSTLKDMNTLTPDTHQRGDYQILVEAVNRELLSYRPDQSVPVSTELTNFREKQKCILEAVIEKSVTIGKAVQLFVQIRRIDSEGIISLIQSVDEEILLDENNVKSKELQIEFPIEQGGIGSAGISLRLTALDFSPPQQVQHIKVPPDGDSEIVTFMVTPKEHGSLILQLEVLIEKTSLISRTIRTSAVESNKRQKFESLYSMPITIIVPPRKQQKIHFLIVLIVLLGIIFVGLIFNANFPMGTLIPSSTSTPAHILSPTSSSTATLTTTETAVIYTVTSTVTTKGVTIPSCPPGNYPPNISLDFIPRSVKVYEIAELIITTNDPENNPYQILAVIADFGRFPNGKQKPYIYSAPSFPETDVITVIVSDGLCLAKAEIIITIRV